MEFLSMLCLPKGSKPNRGGKNIVIDYLPVAVEFDNLKYPILNKEKGRNLIIRCAVKANYLMSFWTNIEKFNKFKRFIDTHMGKHSI